MYWNEGSNQPDGANSDRPVKLFRAAAVRDAGGLNASPGAIAFRDSRVVAAGAPDDVEQAIQGPVERIDCTNALLIPGLVNAHAHLELSAIGPQPYGGDFIGWIGRIMAQRPDPHDKPAQINALQLGADKCRQAGVLTVGDIGSGPAAQVLRDSGLRGVVFREWIGHGDPPQAEHPPASRGVIEGLQPHAPYSTGPAVYRAAVAAAQSHGLPLCTHLAETPEELQFVAEAAGPFRDLLESMDKWRPRIAEHYGRGLHPVDWLYGLESDMPPWLLAHCNHLGDEQIRLLAEKGASVAYCPRASDYFGHRNHPYEKLLAAGVNVCLGTDSIVCHPGAPGLSILDEMRHLHRRDGTDPDGLLAMATRNGMIGLGLNPDDATFSPGARPGMLALEYDAGPNQDPLACVMETSCQPQVLQTV